MNIDNDFIKWWIDKFLNKFFDEIQLIIFKDKGIQFFILKRTFKIDWYLLQIGNPERDLSRIVAVQ